MKRRAAFTYSNNQNAREIRISVYINKIVMGISAKY
jgi:hypothetical protein